MMNTIAAARQCFPKSRRRGGQSRFFERYSVPESNRERPVRRWEGGTISLGFSR